MSMLSENDFYWASVFADTRKNTDFALSKFSLIDKTSDTEDEFLPFACPAGLSRCLFANPLVECQRIYYDCAARLEDESQRIAERFKKFQLSADVSGVTEIWLDSMERAIMSTCGEKGFENTEVLDMIREIVQVGPPDGTLPPNPVEDTKSDSTSNVLAIPYDTEAMRRRFIPTSAPDFELSDVPVVELQERLRKGEIAPREEFIPGKSTYKKAMNQVECQERLCFAEDLKKEAREAMEMKDYARALTLYTQGIHLMEHYTGHDTETSFDIQTVYLTFLRNTAIVSLRLGQTASAIEWLNVALAEDPYDAKAQYLKGKAYFESGDFDSARKEWKAVLIAPHSTDEQRNAARSALEKLKIERQTQNRKMHHVIQKTLNEEVFSEQRPIVIPGLESSLADDSEICNGYPEDPVPEIGGRTVSSVREPPEIDVESFEKLLVALVGLYSRPDVASDIEGIRIKAEFDEKKVIKALQKYIPPLLTDIFKKFGIEGDYLKQKKMFDKAAYYYRNETQIKSLWKQCQSLLIGDEILLLS